ncbi:MAG: nucleotidyl transferase AbiEii/AbiGii toxin family protein [Candidatus Synoicihabitans palmerolidicus]|nr:nucleotidyl transferase AbiEii/AbiGii toxin family protein [Candidatus Synoicihabitans palmerolidicus]
MGPTGWRLEVDPNMADGQCLLFHYPSVFPGGYVAPVVKIELGARSDDGPPETKSIRPYVFGTLPLDRRGCRVHGAGARRGAHVLGESLSVARGDISPGRQTTKTSHGSPLLRPVVFAARWRRRTCVGRHGLVPTRDRTPGDLLSVFVGRLHHPPARHLPPRTTGDASRQLAQRLCGHARSDVLRRRHDV